MTQSIPGTISKLVTDIQSLRFTETHARGLVEGRSDGLPHDRTLALFAFDVDAVQAHVFASPRPVAIQGASEALRAWDCKLRDREILGDRAAVLFAGGGTAAFLARADDDGVSTLLLDAFKRKVPGATFTLARVPFSAHELVAGPLATLDRAVPDAVRARARWRPGGGGFGACVARVHAELRRKKGEPCIHPYLDGERRGARCVQCTSRPQLPGQERQLCTICLANTEKGRDVKRHWDSARSFDDVLGHGRQLAYIKLDGKGIGAIVESLGTMAQYCAVSEVLRDAFEPDASTLLGLGIPLDDETTAASPIDLGKLRMQRTIAGGDDLLLIAPAQWKRTPDMAPDAATDALNLAFRLAKRVEDSVARADLAPLFPNSRDAFARVSKIGVGAGVVISNALAASYCFEVVDDLVKSAKSLLDTRPDAPRSAVDFTVIHGGSLLSSSVKDLRDQATGKPGDGRGLDLGAGLTGDIRMTRRPYTLDAFGQLLDTVRRLPRELHGLHGLRRAMVAPGPGLITLRYQIARNPKLRRALLGDTPLDELPPYLGEWILTGTPEEGFATAIPDLLEIVRIAGEQG